MGSRNRFMSQKERDERSRNSPYSIDVGNIFGGVPQRVKDAALGAAQMIPYGPAGMIVGAGMGSAAGEVNRRTGLVKLGDVEKPAPKPAPTPKTEPQQNVTSRNVDRGGATGTQTGPSPARFDGTAGMDEFMAKLTNKYGIRFGGQDGRGSMQSSKLPTPEEAIRAGVSFGGGSVTSDQMQKYNDAVAVGQGLGGKMAGMMGDEYNTPGAKPNSGISAALSDTDGMRSYMDRVIKDGRENPSDEGPMAYANDGMDARSRAFLDYKGSDSLMALRAADAAQDTVYAGGKLYDVSGKNEDGKYSTINSEMRGYLRDNRNDRAGSQSYKDYYQKNVVEPRQAEKPDTMAPNYSTRADNQQLAQRDMEGTLVMGPENKPEPFENNVNRSYITGSPGQDIYNSNTNPFVDQQEPPTTGFLPDEDVKEEIKRLYLK